MNTKPIISEVLNDKKCLINAWLTIPSSWTAEIIANLGYDIVTIDMQHGLIDYSMLINMLQTITNHKTVSIVRIPWNEPDVIMKSLDAGVNGIICPMINNRKEAEKFVHACLYPPDGYRSFGPIRVNINNEPEFLNTYKDKLLTFAMIETKEAVDDLGDILSVEGLDGIYIGTVDLSISMGLKIPTGKGDNILENTVQQIIDRANESKKLVGIHTQSEGLNEKFVKFGANIITPLNDTKILQHYSREILNSAKMAVALK